MFQVHANSTCTCLSIPIFPPKSVTCSSKRLWIQKALMCTSVCYKTSFQQTH